MRLVIVGDTHGLHQDLDIPRGDVFIHVGDITRFGKTASSIQPFNAWLGGLPHPHKLIIPGNHDYVLEEPSNRWLINSGTLLINESASAAGLKVWGSPTTPLWSGAFGMSFEADRVKLYSQIPQDTDVLLTHGPPFRVLGAAPESSEHLGCRLLLDAVRRVKPRLHIFGHVHGANGSWRDQGILFINAVVLGVGGGIEHQPFVVDLPSS